MKKSKLDQTKIYEVEIKTYHGPRDEIIKMTVKALCKVQAQDSVRKSFKDTYGEYAESLIEIRDVQFLAYAS